MEAGLRGERVVEEAGDRAPHVEPAGFYLAALQKMSKICLRNIYSLKRPVDESVPSQHQPAGAQQGEPAGQGEDHRQPEPGAGAGAGVQVQVCRCAGA